MPDSLSPHFPSSVYTGGAHNHVGQLLFQMIHAAKTTQCSGDLKRTAYTFHIQTPTREGEKETFVY